MVKGKPVPKLKPEKYKTTNTMPHGMKSTSKMVKGKPVPKLKPEKYKKLKVKSKVAKNLKISDAELERLEKASPYDKLDEGLNSRGRGRFGKKIDNKNWDEDRVSHKESVRKFGEHSILYNAGARKGAKSNPFKKKPKKK